MKIRDVIEELERIEKVHGNLNVLYFKDTQPLTEAANAEVAVVRLVPGLACAVVTRPI